jgi:hypothetical protein
MELDYNDRMRATQGDLDGSRRIEWLPHIPTAAHPDGVPRGGVDAIKSGSLSRRFLCVSRLLACPACPEMAAFTRG